MPVFSADERPDASGLGVQSHDRELVFRPRGDAFARSLQIGVEHRVDVESASVRPVHPVFGQQRVVEHPHRIVRIPHVRRRKVPRLRNERDRRFRLGALLCGDRAGFEHPRQHASLPGFRGVGRRARIGAVGGGDHPGQKRRFAEGEIPRMFPEVHLRRCLHTPRSAPEVDLVEVLLQDLILRKLAFKPECDDRLADLPLDRPLAGEKHVARQLLRNRAAALTDAPGALVFDGSPRNRR